MATIVGGLFDPARNSTVFGGGAGSDLITSISNGYNNNPTSVFAGGGNDTILVGGGSDTVVAGIGNDRVVAGGGNDLLYGGAGSDTVYGGGGADIIFGGAGSDSLLGGKGSDSITGGHGADMLVGGNGNDHLAGGAGKDTLFGGAGNDRLEGGAGDDFLVGGRAISVNGGSDTFVFGNGSGNDLIAYFDLDRDVIEIAKNINKSGINTAADVIEHARQVGKDVIIDLGDGNKITLHNINLNDLKDDPDSHFNIV